MAMETDMAMPDLPDLPVAHEELAKHISEHPEKTVEQILQPYREYENQLRSVYAQDRNNPILEDPHLNVLPLFNEYTKYITTRARDLASESEEEKGRYIMPLPEDKRRAHGSPATVANLAEFQKNFNVFSESSLVDVDWNNVVAAGSSVVNCLLPVPDEFSTTKRKLRQYYHEKFCPASDVDLFLYGLTHDEAIEKIQQIEQAVREALLNEVTVVRTKYAITIASQYPVRHIQIVLRVYKSVSEILTGFDIDAAGGAYDGKQVYVTPRALGSFITQINHIDLTRRSPSYENRLSKYSHRNFEVYWPELDRSRVDPTIFERSFRRTLGLARLLVLERLPTNTARENYLSKRRLERGRPAIHRHNQRALFGNIKDDHEDEVADWLTEEEVSNYHTFTVPYGEKFHAKRIEKLCYTRDLLLNAEWNQPKEREVYLHRHPAFFGRVQDVIEDCCGSCPTPKTEEEKEVAEKEQEIYISGKVEFLIDDPGRQQIGSFNPLTEQDWTDMAYVGNTARLCQSIVDGDIDDILNWLSQEGSDPNTRDYTGRTPLHLAVMTSTSEVVKCLVEQGARLTARLADGRTALHLAASRGDTDMIKILMEKSIENEEAEEERKDRRREASKSQEPTQKSETASSGANSDEESDDGEMTDWEQSEADAHSATTGSFIKISGGKKGQNDEDIVPDDNDDEPDYYQIDVLAWDVPCSPLHLAIVGGHEEAVKQLCDYGADSILPVKFLGGDRGEVAALLTLTLALALNGPKAKSMAELLLKLGAVSSQASQDGNTAFIRYVENNSIAMVDTLLEQDKTGVKAAINHLGVGQHYWRNDMIAPLNVAIQNENPIMVLKLLNAGAQAEIDFETWLKSAKVSSSISSQLRDLKVNKTYYQETQQPLIEAIQWGQADIVITLLERRANPNTLTPQTERILVHEYMRRWTRGESALDVVNKSLEKLQKYQESEEKPTPPEKRAGLDTYLNKFKPGTYQHWIVSRDVKLEQKMHENRCEEWEVRQRKEGDKAEEARQAKSARVVELIADMERAKQALISKGAKTFAMLYPDIKTDERSPSSYRYGYGEQKPKGPYTYDFNFKRDKDITEKRRDGYIDLFEAVWAGDINTLKNLTLQAWGDDKSQPPLKMAIEDNDGNSPFSLAFLLGHHDMAKAILDIVKAQWTPQETPNVRYAMKTGQESDDDDSEGTLSEDEVNSNNSYQPPEVDEMVDMMLEETYKETHTIDNIGQVSMQVDSHIQPLAVITKDYEHFALEDGAYKRKGRGSLIQYCIRMEDPQGLKLLLELAQEWAKESVEEGETMDEPVKTFVLPEEDFKAAVQQGNTSMLGMIIKKTGAGIPLDHLVKKSGAELERKPRYYQGLTVYGKKRRDWATAGRNMVTRTTGLKTPPLLHAAIGLNMEVVEFFLSETPNRLYSEFGKSQAAKEDPRLRHLMERPGGFDRAIANWLGADNDLVIHCVVNQEPRKRANELLEYLIEVFPSALEKKTPDGDTPLIVACRLGRRGFVKTLIAGNADQSARNSKGVNLVHAMLENNAPAHRVRNLLDELDPELRPSLFLQRKDLLDNGHTPIQSWLANKNRSIARVELLKLLLEYSKGEGLEMLNSTGDTSLHIAIMDGQIDSAKVLIDHSPGLLYRENAVGRTPAELAYDTLTSNQLERPQGLQYQTDHNFARTLTDEQPTHFLEKPRPDDRLKPADPSAVEELGLSGSYTAHDLAEIRVMVGLVEQQQVNPLPRHHYQYCRNHNHGCGGAQTKLRKHVLWDLCRTAMSKHPHPRRLVSLNEANDVVKRLGEQEMRLRYFSVNNRKDEYEDAEEKAENPTSAFLDKQLRGAAWVSYVDGAALDTTGSELEKCSICETRHD